MASVRQPLNAVFATPGRPLYVSVRDAVRQAIDSGVFRPGEQMPSTKDLSEQMKVSLVTTHRALQELVTNGILRRSQGKGTFVHQRYLERRSTMSQCRVGLVFHAESSLADFYHSQILEGVRQAAHQSAVDLILLRFGEDVRNECNGFLFVNPLPGELEVMERGLLRKLPTLVVGAGSTIPSIPFVDVDNFDLAQQAVHHLAALGHLRMGYVGGADQISNSRDRWAGFHSACNENGISVANDAIIKGASWRLDDSEKALLATLLSSNDRPTAIFAAGYYFALDVYGVAASIGLRVPEQLSIVGVDDPPSAAHLSPPMTTLRQPLVQLGNVAVTTLHNEIERGTGDRGSRTLQAELVVRKSTGPAKR